MRTLKNRLLMWAIPLISLGFLVWAIVAITHDQPVFADINPEVVPAKAPVGFDTVAGSGIVEPNTQLISIAPQVAGVINAVSVSVSDQVKKGDVLFSVASERSKAQLARLESALLSQKAAELVAAVALAEAKKRLELYEAIADSRAMSAEELARRQFAVQSAEKNLDAQKALVNEAEGAVAEQKIAIRMLTTFAPCDGQILQLNARVGEWAPAQQLSKPLVVMGNTAPLHVRIDIDEADIMRLSQPTTAQVTARGSKPHTVNARFVRAEPYVVPKVSLTNTALERVDTRVLQLIFALPDNEKSFYVGQQVDAYVPVGAKT